MSGIRAKNTKPELTIRKALHALGFRYRLHPRDVPGKPDVVLPRYKAAIFVHGCFWHGHDCPLYKLPDTRRDFWLQKISRNVARDAEVGSLLKTKGWRSLTIWECAFRGPRRLGIDETIRRTVLWLSSGDDTGELRSDLAGASKPPISALKKRPQE